MARGGRGGGRGRGGGGRGRGRGGGGKRGGGGGGGGGRQYEDNRQSFDQVHKRNDKFERFYDTLNIVPEGEEREAFWAALRRELPNSFRFTGSKGHAQGVKKNLVERFFPMIKDIKHEGRPVELPQVMDWYPNGLAYSMKTPKNVIRKYEPFKEFQKFLVSETGVGNISRQEHVSMIPPLVLDVRPEHTVLDLCAAPGSKSAQLIEAIHSGEEERVQKAIRRAKGEQVDIKDEKERESLDLEQGRATGLLVANDVNYQRAQMLVHQVKRLNSPNLIVMNHDATMFPSIQLPSTNKGAGKYLKFDRILADVPCSGDGTTRKNPGIWKDWSPQNGLGLYITQVRILVRSLQMLKVGGKVVYSTCSMNPVEDEAVISSAIERCGGVGKVKLHDVSSALPGLKRAHGLTDWSIMNRTGSIYESYPEAESNESEGSKIVPGMFPPGPEEKIPLNHCMRVYPHMQDTGGFFIAVLEKLGEIRAKPENESKCMNKQWSFSEPMQETQNSTFGELMADVKSEPLDAGGHLRKSGPPPVEDQVMGDDASVSAAARQNEEDTGLKRKADQDPETPEEAAAKKIKTDDGAKEGMSSTADSSTRKEHLPVPPANADGVKADGGEPRSEVKDSGANGTNGQAVVSEPVADAVDNAPFDRSTVPAQATTDAPAPAAPQPAPPARKNKSGGPVNEEAFKYLDPNHPELESIYNFYGLHPSFPRDRFLVRNPAGDPVKGIYYSSQLAKDILTLNSEGKGLKFVHAGVKMFMKQDAQGQDICRWRIQTEGLPIVEGWVGEGRVVHLHRRSTLRKLLVEMFPKVGGTEGSEGWRELGEIGEQVRDVGMGCCVLRVEARPEDKEDGFEEQLTLPLWRSMHSLNLMLPKEERRAMLLRIYNEDVELVNHSAGANKKAGDTDADKKGDEPAAAGAEKQANGSVPAEAVANELKEKVKHTDNSATLPASVAADQDSELEDELLDANARSMEEDAVAASDKVAAEQINTEEDDERKIRESMPERKDEGDESNTTV
ncbi:hypothetical protein D0864_09046 [Hortaea werneckii]|uniref:SAM-dependent MTase RsmB/NOP-type domain-containing protein n=1 Tax=Hortaea werneckii TaxID=91943 RepID=A0A3M7ESV9_HORWE|nr:hypothetical protein D0864_09046 [Hortaea werneckii]